MTFVSLSYIISKEPQSSTLTNIFDVSARGYSSIPSEQPLTVKTATANKNAKTNRFIIIPHFPCKALAMASNN